MKIPIYQQIKNKLIKSIEELPANTPIFSERDLAREYNASRTTVRKAIEEMVDEGYLYRNSNKGTFIADIKLRKKNTSLSDEANGDEITYQRIYFDVKIRGTDEIQNILEIQDDDKIVRMIRLVSVNKRPQCIEEIYVKRYILSEEEFGEMPKWKSLNKFIEQGRIVQTFHPMQVPIQYIHMLNLKVNEPIIMVENLITNKNGQPLIYMKVFNNPKEKIIKITL